MHFWGGFHGEGRLVFDYLTTATVYRDAMQRIFLYDQYCMRICLCIAPHCHRVAFHLPGRLRRLLTEAQASCSIQWMGEGKEAVVTRYDFIVSADGHVG